MNNEELKEALFSRAPVIFKNYRGEIQSGYFVNAVVYREHKGKIILEAEINRAGEKLVMLVNPKDLILNHSEDSKFKAYLNQKSGICNKEPEGYEF